MAGLLGQTKRKGVWPAVARPRVPTPAVPLSSLVDDPAHAPRRPFGPKAPTAGPGGAGTLPAPYYKSGAGRAGSPRLLHRSPLFSFMPLAVRARSLGLSTLDQVRPPQILPPSPPAVAYGHSGKAGGGSVARLSLGPPTAGSLSAGLCGGALALRAHVPRSASLLLGIRSHYYPFRSMRPGLEPSEKCASLQIFLRTSRLAAYFRIPGFFSQGAMNFGAFGRALRAFQSSPPPLRPRPEGAPAGRLPGRRGWHFLILLSAPFVLPLGWPPQKAAHPTSCPAIPALRAGPGAAPNPLRKACGSAPPHGVAASHCPAVSGPTGRAGQAAPSVCLPAVVARHHSTQTKIRGATPPGLVGAYAA